MSAWAAVRIAEATAGSAAAGAAAKPKSVARIGKNRPARMDGIIPAMEIRFDHLVVAARRLEEGVAWVESRLGVPMGAGGRHELMGTHNRLLSLGRGRFLEVIAIDPDAQPPARSRWFELDRSAMRARLESGPALVTWVVRTDDIDAAIATGAFGAPEVLGLSRGDYRWRIGVPPDGSLIHAGIVPTIIQWATRHPADTLPDSGCRLAKLSLCHPDAPAILEKLHGAGLAGSEPIEADNRGQTPIKLIANFRSAKNGTLT
jgi:hypothetical protein